MARVPVGAPATRHGHCLSGQDVRGQGRLGERHPRPDDAHGEGALEPHDPKARRVRAANALHRHLDRSCSSSSAASPPTAARHRGLPEPGPAAGRGHHAAERLERRGGRALRHDPARDRALRHARPRPHSLAVDLRLSDVKCYFKWGSPYKDVRQEVINRIQFVTLPAGLQAQLSPWNAIGEIFRYTLGARATRSRT
jgi:hypothetical protein